MTHNYLSDLNEAQQNAVLNTEGPALVIAGAGAGKTRVLTYRIAHLLEKGVPAGSILALTFTNKAAREMKERIIRIAGEQSRYLWMGTFHSIFARILRIDGENLGYKSSFTIYDTTDTKSLLRSIIKDLQLDDKIYKPGMICSRISAAKNNLVTANAYASNRELTERDKANKVPLLADIYRSYSARCFKSNAMDFDDLLLNTNILFRDFPDVLTRYQERFGYILVDEYQDTNYSQYLIVKKLSQIHHNLCVVGDDAQSIYSFRGARIENIFDFRDEYPEYKLFKLEQNYRSTQTIVEAANSIIHQNENQIKKKVFSRNEKGEKIMVVQSMTDSEEGLLISSDIFDLHRSFDLNWNDFAILYRTNAQSRIFEETLRKKNVPYRIYGGLSFYERKEIKDILAYFRMAINPDDEEALKRTINYPKRGIGDTTYDKLSELAKGHNKTVWSIISDIENYHSHITPSTRNKLTGYSNLINLYISKADTLDAYSLAMEISLSTGIMRELKEGQTTEEVSRYENLQELLNAIKEFTEAAETNGEPTGLEAYLANVSLLTDQDNEKEKDRNKVTLMTIHSAKGLEFKHVYVVGMEENLFPSPMSSGTPRELEEERRLFYVAVTRAEKKVTLSYALNRYKWGNLERSNPSRFIKEVDPSYMNYIQTAGKSFLEKKEYNRTDITFNKSSETTGPETYGSKFRKIRETSFTSSPVFVPDDVLSINEGDHVEHERFGKGVIVAIEGEKPNTTATVEFETAGTKKLLLRFAKLRKI
jgi:DNA helicase-2/ATP-dependent DNA helicase PcrA